MRCRLGETLGGSDIKTVGKEDVIELQGQWP
jgi:hypothetical protein